MTARLSAAPMYGMLAVAAALSALTTAVGYLTTPLLIPLLVAAAALAATAIARPSWVLYAALCAVPLEQSTVPGTGGLLTPTETLMLVLAAGWALRVCVDRRTLGARTAALTAFAWFSAATLVSALFAVDPVAAGKGVLMTTVLLVVLHFILTTGDLGMVRRIIASFTFSAVAVSVLSVLGGGGTSQTYIGSEVLTRAQGVFAAPNTLATFLGMALPIAVILALVGPARQRAVGLGATVLLTVGLTSTFSRGGILAAGASVVVLATFAPFRNRVALVAAAAALLLATGLQPLGDVPYVTTVGDRVASVRGASAGDDPRVGIWHGAVHMIGDHPLLGIGAGSFEAAAPAYGLYYPLGTDLLLAPPHAHDLLLNMWVERGLVAALAFLAFLLAIGQHCVRAIRRTTGTARAYAVGVTAALTAFFTQGLVDYTFSTNAIAITIVALSGCSVLLARSAR